MNQEKRLQLVYNQSRCINCLALGQLTKATVKPIQHISHHVDFPGDDVLPTAMIHIINRSRQIVPCRIFLDTGSSTSFIITKFADQL